MFGWFKNKSLKSHLTSEKKISINGVNFIIRKIIPMDFAEGSQVVLKLFDTVKNGNDSLTLSNDPNQQMQQVKKIKKHWSELFMAGVVKPKLLLVDGPDGVCVDEIFRDWDMASKLHDSIYEWTYGKKKWKSNY